MLHAHAVRHPDDPDALLLGAALGDAAWAARGADLMAPGWPRGCPRPDRPP